MFINRKIDFYIRQNMKVILSILLLPIIHITTNTNASEQHICRLFKDGTQLRNPGTCNEYITCTNSTGTVSICPNNKLFDRNKKSCVDETALASDSYCQPVCKDKNNYWAPDLTSCNGFNYCSNGAANLGHCSDDTHFAEAEQMCVYTQDSKCVDVQKICEVAPTNVKFRNDKNCNAYYECKIVKSKLELTSSNCKASEYFHVNNATCVPKHLAACEAHPIPPNVCGKDGSAKSGVFVPDQATCRGYFYCANFGYAADLSPAWGQCPEGTFFYGVTQKCEEPHKVACSYNRCEGRGTRLVESANNDCRNYHVCVDGMPVEERTCSGNLFFNSEIEACMQQIIYYPSCDRCTLTKC